MVFGLLLNRCWKQCIHPKIDTVVLKKTLDVFEKTFDVSKKTLDVFFKIYPEKRNVHIRKNEMYIFYAKTKCA